jgi:hypothetical protein
MRVEILIRGRELQQMDDWMKKGNRPAHKESMLSLK